MQTLPTRTRGIDLVGLALPIIACLVLPGAGVIAAALIVAATLAFRRHVRGVVLDLWWRGLFASLMLGMAAGLGITLLDQLLIEPAMQHIFHSTPDVSALGALKGKLPAYIQTLAIGLLFGGIAEELVFRGFLIGWTTRLFGERAVAPAVVLSSALFGFSHLYQGLAGVAETAIVGLLLATLYVVAGRRLMPSAFAHMTIDMIGITDLYLNGAISDFIASHTAWL
jgi:membrane protease YdiL (CAAX protease family)